MKYLTLIVTFCLFSALSFAQPNSEQRYDSKLSIALDIDDKDKHVLFVGCKEGECDVYWNDKKITTEHTFDAAVDFLLPLKNKDYPNLFLIPVYQGDGCPAMYRILQIPDRKTHYLTDFFGNCNDPEYHSKKKIITFVFEGFDEPINRPQRTYTYNLKKGELVEITK